MPAIKREQKMKIILCQTCLMENEEVPRGGGESGGIKQASPQEVFQKVVIKIAMKHKILTFYII